MTAREKIGTRTKRANQGDIARDLGISRIAVSYALRRSSNVSRKTHERVFEAAERLGYRVNAGARAMRTGTFSNLGLIKSTGWSTSVLPHPLLSAILSEVNNRNRHLVMAQLSDEQLTDPAQLPITIREHIIDGAFIYYTHQVPKGMPAMLKQVGLPSIWLNIKRPTGCVYYDEVTAGAQAAARLIELGCDRFIWMDHPGPRENLHYSTTDRQLGFQRAVECAGFETFTMSPPSLKGSEEFSRIINSGRGKPGIFGDSGSDLVATVVAAMHHGLTPGKDIHLATVFGEKLFIASYPVETVCLNYDGLAASALIMLEKQIEAPTKNFRSVAVPPLPIRHIPGRENSPVSAA
jgi:DNA-binding LacI/PurR family transcriptional regulator